MKQKRSSISPEQRAGERRFCKHFSAIQDPPAPTELTSSRSLTQEYSLGPFPITERLLRKLLTRYAVSPLFLDVLRGVSNETRVSEESYGNTFYRASRTGVEISYQLKYAAKAGYNSAFPWKVRQTEVFHRMTLSTGGSGEPLAYLPAHEGVEV
ncbi:hypothetical protein MPH_09806 [Macrophomina phaseolina MS6]|uniref:Uncharacterized protein n=1 Tax=Macrophomina phaseolina (strain MS6) TaxID=1126212 RepID=K2QTM0_MACPH|nr:hypothetical protein MPH_09806 [Macrophomina phaseolina MS6]